tara:strand:+ start:346 stop:705 length:360 start_codon:yes stop_codon:yes gene_type:complete
MDDGEDFGYIPVQLKVVTAAGASNTVALTLDRAFTVTDVMARNTGGNGSSSDTLQLKNGSNAISDALDMNINDNIIARAASIDDAQHEIAAGGTLNVAAVNAGGGLKAMIVYISGFYHK